MSCALSMPGRGGQIRRWREAQGADNRKHVQGFASLRLACCQMLERNAASGGSGIESWHKEDNLLTLAQKKGRAWSGISAMTEDEAESLGFKCSSGYDATRSAFTYRKDAKELLRGGLENVRDYDMKASFPSRLLGEGPLGALGWQMGQRVLHGHAAGHASQCGERLHQPGDGAWRKRHQAVVR